MFIRKKSNKSGSVSIQIIDKSTGRYRVIKTIGSSKDPAIISRLWMDAQDEIQRITGQLNLSLLLREDKKLIEFLDSEVSKKIRVVGPELVFGKLFDKVGFNLIEDDLFRHLVITRLVYPGSKLKTVDYIKRYQGIDIDISKIYRFLDKLHNSYQPKVEQISFNHTQTILGNKINVIFYDMTTLYFEASDEDDLRVTGFSKDGKHQNPQIFLGLLVGKNGYPIGYNIFEGNIYEGHTLIPILKQFQEKFKIGKPIVIADSGILSNKNLEKLQKDGYQYILGARIKNETASLKTSITGHKFKDGENIVYKRQDESRLIVNYSFKRAKKDAANRKRGLERLEKKVISGKLTKKNINNRGYNKYLKLNGEIKVTIDYEKYEQDEKWDGLKGYITNTKLRAKNVIENYNELWQIEKAFKISKTDLRIRPIYHRIRNRIESHICICFTAYSIYKELERILKITNAGISPERAIELTKTIYMLEIVLPQSEKVESMMVDLDNDQKRLLKKLEQGLRVSQ